MRTSAGGNAEEVSITTLGNTGASSRRAFTTLRTEASAPVRVVREEKHLTKPSFRISIISARCAPGHSDPPKIFPGGSCGRL